MDVVGVASGVVEFCPIPSVCSAKIGLNCNMAHAVLYLFFNKGEHCQRYRGGWIREVNLSLTGCVGKSPSSLRACPHQEAGKRYKNALQTVKCNSTWNFYFVVKTVDFEQLGLLLFNRMMLLEYNKPMAILVHHCFI